MADIKYLREHFAWYMYEQNQQWIKKKEEREKRNK